MAYPIIFRKRAIEAVRNGHTKNEVTKMFNLGANTLRSWEKLEEETGNLEKREVNPVTLIKLTEKSLKNMLKKTRLQRT